MSIRRGSLIALTLLLFAACGGDPAPDGGPGGGAPAAGLPAECVAPPFTMRLEASGEAPAGGPQFEVADAVARRVAILPGIPTATGPEELEANAEAASKTGLALYTVSLSDAAIDRSRLSGFAQLTPEPGVTVAQLSIVPESEDGFAAGDVVDDDAAFEYEPTTTFAEVQLLVLSGDDPTGIQGYDAFEGQVEVLHVDEAFLCLDVDVAFSRAGEPVYAAEGIVTAPVVRAEDTFYFT